MNKNLKFLVVAASVLGMGSSAQAQMISLQYRTNGSPLVSAGTPATAGVVPSGNFNVSDLPYVNPAGPNSVTNLIDSNGNPTGISETTTSSGGFDQSNGGSSFTSGTGNKNLFTGFALGNFNGTGDLTLQITGLNASTSYRLVTFVGELFGGNDVFSGSVNGGTSLFYKADQSLAAYTSGTSTTAAAAASANYLSFTGITGVTSLTFTLDNGASPFQNPGLYGFQLIGTPAGVPEPSSAAVLLTFAISGAGVWLYRRRNVRLA